MPKPIVLPSAAYLRECFSYDPATGVLTWKRRPREHFQTAKAWVCHCNREAGASAGTVVTSPNGTYLRIGLDWNRYKAHRIIWMIKTGQEPPGIIDHADRNPLNNRWNNLRIATPSESACNRKQRTDNTTGHTGVYWHNGAWSTRVIVAGKVRQLYGFATRKEAAVARTALARQMHKEFCRE